MPLSEEEVVERFPLHWLVWNDRHQELEAGLQNNEWSGEQLEQRDPRGRTPLLLAVTLGRGECVRALLAAGADALAHRDGWAAVHEATARADRELLALLLARRDRQRLEARARAVPRLLHTLSLAPDFYVEMKWEFTSWVPLVSRLCPSDVYRVYKRGANVRVDTTLLGFRDGRWERGDRTYMFLGRGAAARLVELDHLAGTVWSEWVEGAPPARLPPPSAAQLDARLRSPLHLTYLDTDKISFERARSGVWGWRQDRTERVGGHECSVFAANNVELVSLSRWEHVPRAERRPQRAPPLAGLLAVADEEPAPPPAAPSTPPAPPTPPTWQQYFDAAEPEGEVGRPRELSSRVQRFRATLWLCEDYPLELREQVMPILDLMAAMSSPHFVKLKEFIELQLPAGFPVKVEIPLFHVMSARVTFGNLFAGERPVAHVSCVRAGERPACLLDDDCFALGGGYREAAPDLCLDDDDELLHYAIEQSLMEAGTQRDRVDVWEALRGARPPPPESAPPPHDDRAALQRAIEESLQSAARPGADKAAAQEEAREEEEAGQAEEDEEGVSAALAASAAEHEAREALRREEERALGEALRRSLLDR